ncbi:MAG: hypothetical protein V3R85_01505 [Alphaproteobacteria bacterium]
MSNRPDTTGIKPHMVDPLQALQLGQAVNNSLRQTTQTVAYGDAFMTLFRAVAGVFIWMDRSISDIQDLRIIFELSDRQIAELGIKRSQIATRCAEGWFA